jgi:Bifunctional DNA primase/polymerase, N-terminal
MEAINGKTREIKSPYTPHGKNNATIDPEIIHAWWKHWPDVLIGIYCERSGFFAVDVDDKNGKNGFRSWENLWRFMEAGSR